MKTKYLAFSLILAMLISSIPMMAVKAANTLSVSPASTSVDTGEIFSIQIVLDSATNLYGYELYLSFDQAKLTALSIEYMNYLNEPHLIFYQEVNNTGGYVGLAASSTYPATGKTGGSPPSLANVTFQARALLNPGDSPLHLYNTILSDNLGNPILHTTVDGIVHVAGVEGRNIAVTNVTSAKTIIGKGYAGNITVTLENQGSGTENFNVTNYANAIVTALMEFSMLGASTEARTFSWNTTGFTYGNYTLKAVAETVPGETNTADNNFTCIVPVHVGVPGDVSSSAPGVYDQVCNMKDVAYLVILFNTKPTSPNWNPNADVDNNGVVNMIDIAIAIINFNKHE